MQSFVHRITILIIVVAVCISSSSYALIKSLALKNYNPSQQIMFLAGPGRITRHNNRFIFPVISGPAERLFEKYLTLPAKFPVTKLYHGPLTEEQSTAVATELGNIPGPGEEVFAGLENICEKALKHQQLLEEQGFAVFYTAQNLRINIIQDLLYMYYQKTDHHLPDNFIFLRDPTPTSPYPFDNVQTIFNKFMNSPTENDMNNSEIRTALVSANVGLVPKPYKIRQEVIDDFSHAIYFLKHNKSLVDTFSLLYSIITSKVSDVKTSERLLTQIRSIALFMHTQTGTLIQIAIPKELVSNIVYPAHPLGRPRLEPSKAWQNLILPPDKNLFALSEVEKEAYASGKPLYEILQIIRHEPTVQVRIVATSPEMLDPKSGVQIIRYDPELLPYSMSYEEYRKKLEEIVDAIIDAENKSAKTSTTITEIE